MPNSAKSSLVPMAAQNTISGSWDVCLEKSVLRHAGIDWREVGSLPQGSSLPRRTSQVPKPSFNVVTYEPCIKLCEELAETLPHGPNTKAMLVSTGAEAVENAIKNARHAAKRPAVP